MKKKEENIRIDFGFLDKLTPVIEGLSKLQGTKTFKTSKGKEAVFSSMFNVRIPKEQKPQAFKKEQKNKTIKPEAKEREPLVDLFDEEKSLKVVAELPGIEKKDIKLELKKNKLIISTKEKKYYKELELPSKARLTKKWTCKNGVLEISLKKL